MKYSEQQIKTANNINLISFLSNQGETFFRSGKEYRWKAHDSVTINNNQWFQHSKNIGGYPIDFVMHFFDLPFPKAMELLLNTKGEISLQNNINKTSYEIELNDVIEKETEQSNFTLPERNSTSNEMHNYLSKKRGLNNNLVLIFENMGYIYEEKEHGNTVFIGYDNNRIARYAHQRDQTGKYKIDIANSDKSYSFNYMNKNNNKLFVFEAPIDLLSFINLFYLTETQYPNMVALGGVVPNSMERFLKDNRQITNIYLCLDNDDAGNNACNKISEKYKNEYSITRLTPKKKDWNEVLMEHNSNPSYDPSPINTVISDIPPVKIITIADIKSEEVKFLWEPYIPFGKYSLLEGDSGLGKTTIAMQIIAACTTGKPLPKMTKGHEPFNCIYQTAEDGLADTIRPRLERAGADLTKVKVIDDSDNPLTLDDARIGQAIKENNVKLVILDPIQAYLGSDKDMNRANEIRPILSKLGKIASETGCAIMLIGHLNKNNSASASQRGLGTIDIIAAARSVLLVGAQKDDYNTRAMCHIKSSLSPAGPTLGFTLGTEEGFKWLGECDITPDDLANGKEIKTETKKEKARQLILKFLSEVNKMKSDELKEKVTSYNIGERTFYEVYSQLNKEGKIKYSKEMDITGKSFFSVSKNEQKEEYK